MKFDKKKFVANFFGFSACLLPVFVIDGFFPLDKGSASVLSLLLGAFAYDKAVSFIDSKINK